MDDPNLSAKDRHQDTLGLGGLYSEAEHVLANCVLEWRKFKQRWPKTHIKKAITGSTLERFGQKACMSPFFSFWKLGAGRGCKVLRGAVDVESCGAPQVQLAGKKKPPSHIRQRPVSQTILLNLCEHIFGV